MRQRVLKILAGARDARREQVRGSVVGPFCQAGRDMTARGLNLALGKQYSGQEMAEHGVAGRADQTLFAQVKRLVASARVEGGCGAANDVLGRVLDHVQHIISVIASEAKQSMGNADRRIASSRVACHRARIRATRWLLAMTPKVWDHQSVIPGRIEDANYDVQLHIGESRDSGCDAAHRPGMTVMGPNAYS